LNAAAERLLESMQLVPPREPGEKLRAAEEAKILELHAQGVTQTDIARAVGCHQSTVSRTLAEYDDSRPLARKYLESRALEMTRRLVSDAKPETILRVLAKLDVVRDDGDSGGADDGRPTIFVGFGLQMGGTMDIHSPKGAAGAGLFLPDDLIILHDGIPAFEGGQCVGRHLALMVERRLSGNSGQLYTLPCPVEEIPPHVKITPEAAAFIRNGMQPAIEGHVVTGGDAA
jgi:hypothetical protein